MDEIENIQYYPLTPSRWHDFELLFGANGACGGCWCMFWHLTRTEFAKGCGEKNKQAMQTLVNSGKLPGIILYNSHRPVAWCSVAPHEDFSALDRSRVLARVDDQPVWSMVCFFTGKMDRGKGLMIKAIKAAVQYALKNGAQIVEGYPIDCTHRQSSMSIYMGVASAFREAGFVEVLRRSEKHPIMRYLKNVKSS